jgi:hypothetical protein
MSPFRQIATSLERLLGIHPPAARPLPARATLLSTRCFVRPARQARQWQG